MMTYEEALAYIHGIGAVFCKPGLERIDLLCEKLGHPERGLKFIHVGGTNGKGSFCSMLDSVLRASGLKVGLYTSPYIVEFGERMRVNGENIPHDRLAAIVEGLVPIAEAMEDKPTEFEFITAVAFEYFKEEACDVVVLEVGLGGRLDSTNVIRNPYLSVITGISLDHTAILGDTVEKIAYEKAGIIKDGAPVIFGGTDVRAEGVIREVAKERGSELYTVDYSALEITGTSLSGSEFNFGLHRGMRISLLGSYQPRNAAIVLSAVDMLRTLGLDIPEDALRRGLLSAVWHARFEIISDAPLIIYDGAHNPEGVAAAVESIKQYFDKKVYLLSGVLRDKDYLYIAKRLSEVSECAFTMTPDNPRALSAAEWADALTAAGVSAVASESMEDAVRLAVSRAEGAGVPLVCLGSLYTYGDVVRLIEKIKEEKRI